MLCRHCQSVSAVLESLATVTVRVLASYSYKLELQGKPLVLSPQLICSSIYLLSSRKYLVASSVSVHDNPDVLV